MAQALELNRGSILIVISIDRQFVEAKYYTSIAFKIGNTLHVANIVKWFSLLKNLLNNFGVKNTKRFVLKMCSVKKIQKNLC